MKLPIEIEATSGFCFGVTSAIQMAEEELQKSSVLYCLGDIVHNRKECERLCEKGLTTINRDDLTRMKGVRVLLRAHGEPPETYAMAHERQIEIIDATCPVVLRLQQRIKKTFTELQVGHQIVIFGKKQHAEVLGLVGQTEGTAVVVETLDDARQLDFCRSICLFSQTTQPLDEFYSVVKYIDSHIVKPASFSYFDTVCRRVANRQASVMAFAKVHDVVLFVCGRNSSNGKVLFDVVKSVNPRSYLIEGPEEIRFDWLQAARSVGICGATSTPHWLLEACKSGVERL